MVVQACAAAALLPDRPSFVQLCIFVSKPAPDCNDPLFVQLPNIELGEAPAARQVVLYLFHALVLKESIDNRLGTFARIIRHHVHPADYSEDRIASISLNRRLRCSPRTGLI